MHVELVAWCDSCAKVAGDSALSHCLLGVQVLPEDRVAAVETGGCPHAAIREDISANLAACEELTEYARAHGHYPNVRAM